MTGFCLCSCAFRVSQCHLFQWFRLLRVSGSDVIGHNDPPTPRCTERPSGPSLHVGNAGRRCSEEFVSELTLAEGVWSALGLARGSASCPSGVPPGCSAVGFSVMRLDLPSRSLTTFSCGCGGPSTKVVTGLSVGHESISVFAFIE